MTLKKSKRGFAAILALVLITIMAAMAVAYAVGGNTNLLQSGSQAAVQRSLLTSESGLAYLTYILRGITVPPGKTGPELLSAVATALGTRLNGTANLHGAAVTSNATTVFVPTITTDEGQFTATIVLVGDNAVHVKVAGSQGGANRAVGINFDLSGAHSSIFDYGIASKSAIRLTGNASVAGANNRAEANILSATYSNQEAFKLNGNTVIDGDIYSSNPDSYATLIGNNKIGGVSSSDPNINSHIHVGVGNVEFPEVDQSVFEPFATNIVNSSTSTSGNKTFTNIRIKAGTNPTFSGNITVKGVMFVEAPNRVTFAGNLNFTGVIVTEDAGDNVYTTNTIRFTGNSTFQGVESLPDTSEFSQLRQMPGSFMLAPGFGVTFTGNFGSVGGCMAADAFTWAGNATGNVKGPVINYSDSEFTLTGNSKITIDRSTYPGTPPGFSSIGKFAPDPASYREY